MCNDKQSVVAGNAADDFLNIEFIDENARGISVSAKGFDDNEILSTYNIDDAVSEKMQKLIVVSSFVMVTRYRVSVLAFGSVDFYKPEFFYVSRNSCLRNVKTRRVENLSKFLLRIDLVCRNNFNNLVLS